MGRLLGYARVSTADQEFAMQVDALRSAGVADVDLFTDVVTGARADRPGLAALFTAAGEGDTIVVWRLDRLGRSLLNLADLAERLRQRGVGIRSLTDGVDTTQATGRLLYGILSTLAEYERETIRTRVRAGMQAARKAGIHCGRRSTMSKERTAEARRMIRDGRPARQVARILQVSEATLYRAFNRWPEPKAPVA